MATLRETICSILTADAQDGVEPALGYYLAKTGAAPYGLYFMHPPEKVTLPVLTYYFNTEALVLPRMITINFTAWGGDFDLILERIYTLFHDQTSQFNNITDFSVKFCRWNWYSPDRYAENLKGYYKVARFIIQAVRR
jgi:hypothetical protein